MAEFDPQQHRLEIDERYRQISRYQAFDALIDLALDGAITMEGAKIEWFADETEKGIVDE